MLTPDKERVKELLCETITLLCKKGLHFQDEFCIDGLIGITLDQREVFLVTIKETVKHGEVFVRDRQHSTRLQAIEELPHGSGDNQIAAGSEGDSRSELRLDPDSVSRLQDASLKELEREAATSPVVAKVSRHCQMEIDEEIEVKTEEGDDSRDRVEVNRTTANERRQKSSRVVENVHCPSSHNAESQTSPAAEAEQLHDPSIDRSHDDYLPIVPYNEMNSTITCRDQSKESPDLNSQLSIESSAQSQFSSTDRYYRAATVGRCEDKMASDGCDSGQNSNQKPDAEESDGDELVVVKVEPPSSDYPDDQFSSVSSYRQTQANNDAFNFAPDSGGYMYNRIKDAAGYPGRHSHGVTPFDYGSQVAEASVHNSGYSQEIEVKTEEGDDSRDRVEVNRTTANERRQKSSRVVENVHCPSSHNAESQTSPAAEAEQLHDPSVDRSHDDYLPIVPYNEMNSTITCRDQSKESPDLNSQLSIESSAQSQFSSTDRYYRAATVGRCEDKMASDGCDSGQNSNQKPDADESDGDELVVVKVEPPSSDYPDDQFSSVCTTGIKTSLDILVNMRMELRRSIMAAKASVHNSGYGQQFSQSFQMNRYQMKSAMNHGALQNDTSQSPHTSGLDKNQPNSLHSAMTKPYRRLDYSKGTPEHDLHQMPFQAPPLPDLNNSLLESESSSMMQTDLEKYAETQNCCMNPRARSTFTAYQLQRLESAFNKCEHYIDAGTRSKLAEELNLSDSIISVWFQNRRQKFKKQMWLHTP